MISVLFSIMLILLVLPLAIVILLCVGAYKMYEKAGVEGWKAIIPFYNVYVLSTEICKLNSLWGLAYIFAGFIPIIGTAIAICAHINVNCVLAKKFNQDEVGLILTCIFPQIMYCVYGFGSATFADVDMPEHGIFQSVIGDNTTTSSSTSKRNTTSSSNSFCTHCGSQLKKGDKFCQTCGSETK